MGAGHLVHVVLGDILQALIDAAAAQFDLLGRIDAGALDERGNFA